jgi:hypothetical protein
MGYLPAELGASNPGVMGMAIPGGRFALEDDEGNEVIESGQRAELIYYGENVTLGYATCREDLNKDDERRGASGDGRSGPAR